MKEKNKKGWHFTHQFWLMAKIIIFFKIQTFFHALQHVKSLPFSRPIYTSCPIRFVYFNETMGEPQSLLSDFNLLRLVNLCHVWV